MPKMTVSTALSSTAAPESVVIIGATATSGSAPVLYARNEYADLADSLAAFDVSGSIDAVSRISDPTNALTSIVVVGLGSAPVTVNTLRAAAGAAVRRLAGTGKVTFAFPLTNDDEIQAVLEGGAMGTYAFTSYKSVAPVKSPVGHVDVWAHSVNADRVVSRAMISAEAVALVKDLVNTPPNDLYPETFTQHALTALEGLDVTHEIWDEKKLKKDGFGGILGVGMGSSRPPRLMKVTYDPAGASQHVALVGKGITFDTGGLSLKPPASMIGMKYDMTGAATALAVIRGIASSALPLTTCSRLWCTAKTQKSFFYCKSIRIEI